MTQVWGEIKVKMLAREVFFILQLTHGSGAVRGLMHALRLGTFWGKNSAAGRSMLPAGTGSFDSTRGFASESPCSAQDDTDGEVVVASGDVAGGAARGRDARACIGLFRMAPTKTS